MEYGMSVPQTEAVSSDLIFWFFFFTFLKQIENNKMLEMLSKSTKIKYF